MSPGAELNRIEVWIAEHSIRILLVVAVLVVVGGYFVAKAVDQAGETSQKVTRIEPQVTRVNKAICDAQSLNHAQRAERCAERIRVGLINCRHSNPCRAAFLAIVTYPPKARPGSPSSTTATTTAPSSGGGDAFQPSTGHQQPGPGDPGHSGGDHGQGASPVPSPGSSAAPGASTAPEASPPPETPGNGAQGGSTSGAGVEVCALERCVGAEVGLGN